MTDITRKDFLNATTLGDGAALMRAPSPLEAMIERGAAPAQWTSVGADS